jgi:Rieske Fe-S protein
VVLPLPPVWLELLLVDLVPPLGRIVALRRRDLGAHGGQSIRHGAVVWAVRPSYLLPNVFSREALNKEIPMFIYDDLRSVFAKSGYTLSMALIIVVTGVGAPVGDVVAQVTLQPIEMQPIEIQTNEIQNIEMQNNEIQTNEIENIEMQNNEIENIELQQNRQSEFNPTEINPTEINPTDINATEINPTDINASEINPTEINPTEINPTDIHATEIKPTEITPTEITPLQDDFFVKKANPAVAEEAVVQDVAAANAPAGAAAAGPNMGPILLIGGAAAAAGLAGIALSGLSTTSGADCGSAPTGFGSAWWTEYSAWCRCMGGTPIVSTTQCVQ